MTLTTQFYTLITMIGMGSCFGASLDTYQLFLKRTERRRWIVFIHDLLFWLIQALLVFYVLFLVNQGELRFYSFLALVCGFAAYQALFKKSYLFILKIMIAFVKGILRLIKKICEVLLVKPILAVILLIVFLVKLLYTGLFSLVQMILKVVIWVIRVILVPFVWLLRRIFKILPKAFTHKMEKLYNHIKGFFIKVQKYIKSVINHFKNKRKI